MSVDTFPLDVWGLILERCDVLTAVALTSTCRKLRSRFNGEQKVSQWMHLNLYDGFARASFLGDCRLVDLFISKGALWWPAGLCNASRGGHRHLVDFFLAKGVTHVVSACFYAFEGGFRNLANHLFAQLQVGHFRELFELACVAGHRGMVEFLISKGLCYPEAGLEIAVCAGHRELVELFISQGAHD